MMCRFAILALFTLRSLAARPIRIRTASAPAAVESEDLHLGAQAYEQVLHDPKVKISHDLREVEPVKRVATRIIEAAKSSKYAERAKKFDWESA